MVCSAQDGNGYIVIKIDGNRHYGHRLAFLYMTGEWSKHLVDHKPPGMKSDNRWENIREATYTQNAYNRGPDRDNSWQKASRPCRYAGPDARGVHGMESSRVMSSS